MRITDSFNVTGYETESVLFWFRHPQGARRSVRTIAFQTIRNTLLSVAALALLIFLPAGTLAYWQAWVFIIVFLGAATAIGLYLAVHDPELLERRKKAGPMAEQQFTQKIIVSLLIPGVIALPVIAALDHRFGWSSVPIWLALLGDALVLVGLAATFMVLRENRFGASTIRTFEGQSVVSTGPYALVRHPMYTGALIMIAGVPLALGSWWGLVLVALLTPLLMWRAVDEERLLKRELPGYAEYTQRVSHRLVPGVW
jgi:protein-S-isoprenylcysteine O-methyltransferase Ste14